MLSLPTIDGEIVENVVPLAARVEIDGRCLGYAIRFELVLRESVRLLVDTGLAMSDRSIRACSMLFNSAFRCMVDRGTGPLLLSDCREGGLTGIGGAVPGM